MIDTETPALVALKERLRTIMALTRAANVLSWDQRTHMPPGGIQARAEQLAMLRRQAHAVLIDARTGDLLERARDEATSLPPDSDDTATVRLATRDYTAALKLPEAFIAERSRTASLAGAVWIEARLRNEFATFLPWLRQTVEYSRRAADYLGYPQHPMDALIDQAEPGMTTASVRALFADLRLALTSMLHRIARQADRVDDAVLRRHYPEPGQERLGRAIAARFGYDFERGRLDRTTHPFETAIARDDVRITTRYDPDFFAMSFMGTLHETGHALYEQGIAPALDGLPIGRGTSPGMHESQSRLWENHVGRGRPFWTYCYPQVRAAFPGVLDDVDADQFYRALNKVQPSLIRVEADEVTYCLHIMLRFELETALIDGSLDPADVPEAWNTAMESYLGLRPATDSAGALQDIHWSSGLGGFQGYALGNIIAAQLWEAILDAHPSLPEQIATGTFDTLLEWLHVNIYQHGRKYDPGDLVENATGSPLHTQPYIRYLQTKFGDIYAL